MIVVKNFNSELRSDCAAVIKLSHRHSFRRSCCYKHSVASAFLTVGTAVGDRAPTLALSKELMFRPRLRGVSVGNPPAVQCTEQSRFEFDCVLSPNTRVKSGAQVNSARKIRLMQQSRSSTFWYSAGIGADEHLFLI